MIRAEFMSLIQTLSQSRSDRSRRPNSTMPSQMAARAMACVLLLILRGTSTAQPPPQAVAPETISSPDGTLHAFRNSVGLTEVLAISDAGTLLGRREKLTSVRSLRQHPFLRRDGKDEELPIPSGFTSIDVFGLSEAGSVVGYTTRPIGHPNGSQRAVVWSNGAPTVLPVAAGYRDAVGHDMDAAGSLVTGIQLGRDPPRIVPCVWHRTDDQWQVSLLETPVAYNPLLSTARVVMSPNGKRIAASLVASEQGAIRSYALYFFERRDESWIGRPIVERAVHLADLNDAGTAVGRILFERNRRAFVVQNEQGRLLPIPEGHVSSYATSVNAHDQIVGHSSEPRGPHAELSACLWHNSRNLHVLRFSDSIDSSTALAISNSSTVAGQLFCVDGTSMAYTLRLNPRGLDEPAQNGDPPNSDQDDSDQNDSDEQSRTEPAQSEPVEP